MKRIAISLVIVFLLLGITIPGCNGGGDNNGGGNGNGGGYTPPPSPASFSVSDLIIENTNILANETVMVLATISNTGGVQGTYNAVLGVNGEEVETRNLTIGASSSQSVTFSLEGEAVGSYNITIGNLSGSLTVIPVTAENIIQLAGEAVSGVSTYQFDQELYITFTSEGEETTGTGSGSGIVDIAEIEAYQLMEMDISEYEDGPVLMTTETYIAGGWLYERTDYQSPETPVETGTWWLDRIDEEDWKWIQFSSQGLSDAQMENYDYQFISTEMVDGVECYKLQSSEELAQDDLSYEYSSLLWVAKDTHFIVKVSSDVTQIYSGEAYEYNETYIYHHFNEPATIEVPLEATEVTFPDPNLEALIREILNKAEGSIYLSDLDTITILEAQDRGIWNLAGLEYCINLHEINLANNSISSIWQLVENDGLSSGDTVDLRGNPLTSYSQDYHIPQLVERGISVTWDPALPPPPSLDPQSLIGNPAPNFSLMDLDGNTVSLSDFSGSPIMLNFWATWCGPCTSEMPHIQQVHENWQDEGLVILAINLREENSTVNQFIQDNSYVFSVILDSTGNVADNYYVTAIPTTFFVDEDGIIREVRVGSFPSVEAIEEYLNRLIA